MRMNLDIISYHDLVTSNLLAEQQLEIALVNKGIVGISHVPEFEMKSRNYINAARKFSALQEKIKQQYAPDRDAGNTEGYELGAEKFKDQDGNWQIDDKKASYYAYVPEKSCNVWPLEVDLQTPYVELGELIFKIGKLLLKAVGLDAAVGLDHDLLEGYGRMLHYHKEDSMAATSPDWCGAHFDHGVFTGLMPAYYFREDEEINEPEAAGLYVVPTGRKNFEKVQVTDKSILLFQVGEFGQLLSDDRIRATRHTVKKVKSGIERFTFALFYSANAATVVKSTSVLIADTRYAHNQSHDGSMTAAKWHEASYARYRAK
jgi:isopenicillin N synthase-like dioxygenase